MDVIGRYLDQHLLPHLRGHGVSDAFADHTAQVVRTQMFSLVRHWDDLGFRRTALLLGAEEGVFYEPPAKTEIRCFVVVTLRNSPFESLQSDACGQAGLPHPLDSMQIRQITREAVEYFSRQDFGGACRAAKQADGNDLYLRLAQRHPVAWASLGHLAGMQGKSVDYPRLPVRQPYPLSAAACENTPARRGFIVNVHDGYSPEIEAPLAAYLEQLCADPSGMFFADSLKSVTRNPEKLLDILEFLLTRDIPFVSTNYYLENGHAERRTKPLRAGHSVAEMQQNMASTAGLAHRHGAALRRLTRMQTAGSEEATL